MDFLVGGLSATCAGFFSNPFDVIKTRQQLHGELQKSPSSLKSPYKGFYRSVRTIVESEGVIGLQKGLVPALMFQFIMNSIRLGLYETLDNKLYWTRFGKDKTRSSSLCIFWGGAAGVVGSTVSCPLYRIKVRMQSHQSKRFKGAIHSIKSIYRQYGALGLWKGCSVMIPRTGVASAAQLASFSKAKEIVTGYELFEASPGLNAMAASLVSGFVTAVFMTPFDVVATRLFNQGFDKQGRGLLYTGIQDCFIKIVKTEGLNAIYKGFLPNYLRLAPHTVLNFTFWEQFKKYI